MFALCTFIVECDGLLFTKAGSYHVFCHVFWWVTAVSVFLRPRETEAGLLLHRHLLSQQHLRVCVFLLPARVTKYSLPLLPAKDQGNKVVFLAPSTWKKRTKKKNKSQLWLFPLCHTAASKPMKQPTPPVHFHPSERERSDRRRQAVMVIAKALSSLSSCLIPSLVAHFTDHGRKIPLFLYVPLIVFPVTYCCSVIMCNRSFCNVIVWICPIKDCWYNFFLH